jgi:hypothetical protein
MTRVLNYKHTHSIPTGAVYIGRANQYYRLEDGDVTRDEDHREVSRSPTLDRTDPRPARARGWDLVCWCTPLPCHHGDLLLRLANAVPRIHVKT